MNKFLSYIKAHKVLAGFVATAVVLVGFGVYRSQQPEKIEYITEKVQVVTLKQTVSATGKVDSEGAVDLKFNAGGDIAKIYVATQDIVESGKLLAELRHTTLDNQIREAQAALSLQRANLLKVIQGAKEEEILISLRKVESAQSAYNAAVNDFKSLQLKLQADLNALQTQLNNTKTALADAQVTTDLEIGNTRTNLLISLNQGILKSMNSENKISDIFDDADLVATFSATDPEAKNQSEIAHDQIGNYISIAQTDYDRANFSKSMADIRVAASSNTIMLNKVDEMLKWMLRALNATLTNSNLTPAELDAYKTMIRSEQDINNAQKIDLQTKSQLWESAISSQPITLNSAQSAVNTAQANLEAANAGNQAQLTKAQSAIDAAKNNLDLAKAELALTQSKARSADIAIAQAQVNQAASALANVTSQLANYQLMAPFAGVIGKVNFKENEAVTQNDIVISLIGGEQFKITVDIPESDIVKISLGNPAEITLDAYGSDKIFTGKVVKIEPSETVIQDVVYYKVDIDLDPSELEIKKGMTANIDILAQQRANLIAIPQRAVLLREDGTKYVRLLVNEEVVETIVTTGLRGDESKVEIISGLEAGDEVIIFEKKSS